MPPNEDENIVCKVETRSVNKEEDGNIMFDNVFQKEPKSKLSKIKPDLMPELKIPS